MKTHAIERPDFLALTRELAMITGTDLRNDFSATATPPVDIFSVPTVSDLEVLVWVTVDLECNDKFLYYCNKAYHETMNKDQEIAYAKSDPPDLGAHRVTSILLRDVWPNGVVRGLASSPIRTISPFAGSVAGEHVITVGGKVAAFRRKFKYPVGKWGTVKLVRTVRATLRVNGTDAVEEVVLTPSEFTDDINALTAETDMSEVFPFIYQP